MVHRLSPLPKVAVSNQIQMIPVRAKLKLEGEKEKEEDGKY
jgi:hypothetical protein